MTTTAPASTKADHADDTCAAAVPLNPQPTPAPAAAAPPAVGSATRASVRGDGRGEQLGVLFTPPELWAEQRPSLQDLWNYATHGAWVGDDAGDLRRALGRIYAAAVALPLHAAAYTLCWLAERPARLLVSLVLAGLVYLSTAY